MPWPCRFVLDPPRRADDGRVEWSKLAVGSMWFYDMPEETWRKCHLADFYWQNNTRRAPICVLLPGPNYFLVDGKCYARGNGGYYGGWTVTGRAPLITVHPSINIEGRYHGHLVNGVISNDVDGRVFDAEGNYLKGGPK